MVRITEHRAEVVVDNLIKSRDWRKFLYEIGDNCYKFGKYSRTPKENFIERVAQSLANFSGDVTKSNNFDSDYVLDILKKRMDEKGLVGCRQWANEIKINQQELSHILAKRRGASGSLLRYLHMHKETRTFYSHLPNKAPEDSLHWKCNWVNCEGGCGLSGNGFCSFDGYWWDKTCPKYVENKCQHGVYVTMVCDKCYNENKLIIARIEGNVKKKTISGLVK